MSHVASGADATTPPGDDIEDTVEGSTDSNEDDRRGTGGDDTKSKLLILARSPFRPTTNDRVSEHLVRQFALL